MATPARCDEAEPGWRRQTLLSAERGVGFGLEPQTLTPQSLGVAGVDNWRVTTRTLCGGLQEGVRLVEIDSGSLQITLIPTRGMSLLSVTKGDLRLGWDSPVKEVVHPQWVNHTRRGGLGWLDGFNEFMVRCGLEFAGHPGYDDAAGADLTLHGRIGNLPASELTLDMEEAPPHRLRIRGIVQEQSFHGAKLELATQLTTAPGSDEFELIDTVTNRGGVAQEFQLIYHSNYGAPLLEEGAMLRAPLRSVTPMNADAVDGLDSYAVYKPPTPGFVEQVYLMEPLADAAGQALALLHNAAGEAGASIRWSTAQLPGLTQWKDTGAVADGYVTGVEPGTGYPFDRSVERRFGRVPQLAAGESREFRLVYGLHDNADSVQRVIAEVEHLQAGAPVALIPDPPTVS